MKYQIEVSCDPSKTPPVTCTPPKLDIQPGTNEIQWVMAPGPGQIAFVAWQGVPPSLTQYPSGENDWTAIDDNTNPPGTTTTYSYVAGVTLPVTYATDPEIANEPGTVPVGAHALVYGRNAASAETPSR